MDKEAMRLATCLHTQGKGVVNMPDGKRMFLVVYDWENTKGILLAGEEGGVLFWDKETGILTPKILQEAGFISMDRAGVAQTLNAVIVQCAQWKRNQKESAL